MTPSRRIPTLSRRGRKLLRWVALALGVACAWPGRPEGWFSTSLVLPALSPLTALGGATAARSIGIIALLALPGLVLAWAVPRFLCSHLCPVGLLQELVSRLFRRSSRSWRGFPAVGLGLALATLAGALLGYPLFLWLDPFAIFNGALHAWRAPLAVGNLLAGLLLPLLLLVELVWPQLWCRRLCPLGATQDLLRYSRRALIPRPPRGAPATTGARSPARRWFLVACGGAAGAWAARRVQAQPPPLRPPGALAEAEFAGVCVRCGNCAQACPSHIIQPDFAGGLAGLLAPRLTYVSDFCREGCTRCHQVCPSGAIQRLALPEKRRAIIGLAQVDLDPCLMALGRECNACVQACPFEAISVAAGPDGFSSRPLVDPPRCNGCGACEAACPVRPLRAIVVQPAPRGSLAIP
ncbi:MAG: 4Fe-4S binding protein [Verrucomicrobia bacterium]|nr:4Fe-4S binding protein [Verrucomicrobiota bacterium]